MMQHDATCSFLCLMFLAAKERTPWAATYIFAEGVAYSSIAISTSTCSELWAGCAPFSKFVTIAWDSLRHLMALLLIEFDRLNRCVMMCWRRASLDSRHYHRTINFRILTSNGRTKEKVLQCPLAKQIEQPLPDLTPFLDKPTLCEWARFLDQTSHIPSDIFWCQQSSLPIRISRLYDYVWHCISLKPLISIHMPLNIPLISH